MVDLKGSVVVGLVALAIGGCRAGALAGGELAGGTAGTGGAATGDEQKPAGVSEIGSPGSPAGSPVAGPAAPCGTLALNASLTLAPAAAGQLYQRCGTLGPEAGWMTTLSPHGDRMAALTAAGTVHLIATDSWTDVAQLASPLGRVDATAFSPDGTTVATLSFEMGQIALWRASTGTLLRTVNAPPASGVETTGGALGFSSDGRRLATSLGTVIDLASGTSTSWLTGAPSTSMLALNPENLAAYGGVGSIALIRFTAGDARLLVETQYEVGNSPGSTRVELRDPTTGAQVKLFDMYERALAGFALSPDGRHVAVGKEGEASAGGFKPGLSIFDATTGAETAFDPSFDSTFADTVLGFSPDGARLYTRRGSSIGILAANDLHSIRQFDWPTDGGFLGISPTGDLVGSSGATTQWWDPTGTVVRTVDHALGAVTWSADGRFGAGTGDPARLFDFWREADGAPLCTLAADTTPAPPLVSLGTPGPGEKQSVTSTDGSVSVTSAFIVHTHATNYDASAVTDTASGTLLRQFGVDAAIALSSPSADRLFTNEGRDVAVWCR